MTGLGGRLMAELLAKDLDRGVVRFDGTRLLTSAGVAVEPRLAYVPDLEPRPVASQAGIRLGSEHNEDQAMTYKNFAALPRERLVHSDAERARQQERSQRAAIRAALDRRQLMARTPWPDRGFAKLPEETLPMKK